jgi:hypothetical protein
VVMVRGDRTGTREGGCDFEAEFALLGVAPQAVFIAVVAVMMVARSMAVQAAALVRLVFFDIAVLALVAVIPDVVALKLGWLIADCESSRWPDWSVGERVWVVVVTVVFIVGKSDETGSFAVASDDGTQRRRRRALAGAGAGEVEIRHCLDRLNRRYGCFATVAVVIVVFVGSLMVLQCW